MGQTDHISCSERTTATGKNQMVGTNSEKLAHVQTSRIAKVQQQIQEAEQEQREIDGQLQTTDPDRLVKDYIRKLHEYNEIRDVGQGLMDIIANQKGVRVVDVYRDYEVNDAN